MQIQDKTTNDNFIPFKAEHINEMKVSAAGHPIFHYPEMLVAYELRGGSYSFYDNGKLYAVGGIFTVWEGLGEAWFILADDMDLPVKKVCSEVKKLFNELCRKYRRVQASVKVKDEKAVRFIEWLGLTQECVMKFYGPEGDDYYLYARGEWQEQ